MDGIQYNDRDFFQEQQEEDRCWKWPLNLAIGLHVVVFAASIILPGLIERKPLLDNVVTVDLVSMPELAATPPAAAKPVVKPPEPLKQAPVVKPVEPPPEPKAAEVSVAPEPEVAPTPAAPAKPISLKPLKRKIRKAKDTRLAEEKERDQRAKALKQQALARKKAEQARNRKEQARRQKAVADARRAQQEAEQAAARARQELASVIRETGAASAAGRSSASSSGRTVQSVGLQQYSSSLSAWITSQWMIPEMLKKNRNLKTTVALTIRRDGTIADLQIERKSGDPFFDQSVMKIFLSASAMPRFPGVLKESSLEFVLDFDPSGLVN